MFNESRAKQRTSPNQESRAAHLFGVAAILSSPPMDWMPQLHPFCERATQHAAPSLGMPATPCEQET